jgi:hypothetical protein
MRSAKSRRRSATISADIPSISDSLTDILNSIPTGFPFTNNRHKQNMGKLSFQRREGARKITASQFYLQRYNAV